MNCTGDQEIGDVCPIFYSGSVVSTIKLLHTNFQIIILKIVGSPGFEKLCCIITKNLAAYRGREVHAGPPAPEPLRGQEPEEEREDLHF